MYVKHTFQIATWLLAKHNNNSHIYNSLSVLLDEYHFNVTIGKHTLLACKHSCMCVYMYVCYLPASCQLL